MEENLRRNVHSPLSDPDPFDGCRTELTRMNTDSSATTVDAFKDFSHHYAAPLLLDQSTKWTDQQHRLYLNSLEASFVNELHNSMQLRGWSLQNDSKEAFNSRTLQNSLNMPKQYLVLQDGCWKKISLERNEPMLQSTADFHVLAGSPLRLAPVERGCASRKSDVYDHGILCDEGIHMRGISTLSRRSHTSLEKHCVCPSCHLELVGCTAEVTDQNFKDEDQEASSSCAPMAKRLKTATTDATSNDKVVPFGKFHKTDVSSSINSSSENKGQHELPSELPENFHYPKSDLQYFLRGT